MKVDRRTIQSTLQHYLGQGFSYEAIGRKLNVNASTVGFWVRRHKLDPAQKAARNLRQNYGDTAIQDLLVLLGAGTPLRVIAKQFGVSRQRVHQWRKVLCPHLGRQRSRRGGTS